MASDPTSTGDVGRRSAPGASGVLLAGVLTTVSSVYPAFLAGALGAELRSSLDLTERFFGLTVAGFFLGSALGSVSLGRLGERLGARRMITISLVSTAVVTAIIAAAVRTGPLLVAALAVAGVANAAGQTAANKLLSQGVDPAHLGFAMAVKQSGMPSASLLGGLAVPVIALTVGWQWAYAGASVLALVSLRVVLAVAPSEPDSSARPESFASGTAEPQMSSSLLTSSPAVLRLAAVAAAFSSAAAGTLGNWSTSSAVAAGWSTGAAGLLLSFGSLTGIATRLLLGRWADRSSLAPMRIAAGFLAMGALGAVALAPRSAGLHLAAIPVAFGAGWAWPALFNFGVVGTNPKAAAHATGVTQTGVYIGVFSGPLLMGVMVEAWGYERAWLVIACSMVIGASIMATLAPRFVPAAVAQRSVTSPPPPASQR